MKSVTINGKDRFCFVIKDGDASTIVIPSDILAPVDYNRIANLEAKGGELMRTLRDETLDNGKNALEMYSDLFIVVPKMIKPKQEDPEAKDPEDSTEKPKKRGRGRPRKEDK